MLENWLDPVPEDKSRAQPGKHTLGAHLKQHNASGFPTLKKVQVALIGTGAAESKAIRRQLYPLTFSFPGLRIADLGNLKRKSPDFAVSPLRELIQGRIVPVLLSPDIELAEALYDAFRESSPHPSMVLVDERLHLGRGELTHRLRRKRPFHLGLIGGQAHFIRPAETRAVEKGHFDLVRLGKARSSIYELEPVLRDADLMSFHLQALKPAELPGLNSPSPSGFWLEEGCQICRYAGLSDKMKACLIAGYDKEVSRQPLFAMAIAQLIWYLLEGISQRKGDYPVSTDGMTEYVVEVKDLDYQLVFWKSNKTGRWWMQIAVEDGAKEERHRLLPCAHSDYLQARQGEVPDRLLHALNRFS